MNIILVRHVETYGNIEKRFNGITESDFTDYGKEMLQELVTKLIPLIDSLKIKKIYTSPIKRASDIAEIIRERTDLPLIQSEILKEYNFGIFDGLKIKDCMKLYPEIYDKWINNHIYERIPEGDSYKDKFEVAKDFVKQIVDKDESAIIITHGATLRCLLTALLDLPIESGWHFNINLGGFCVINYNSNYGVLDTLDNSIYQTDFIKNFNK